MILFLVTAILALLGSWDDAEQIRRHEDIDHAEQWAWRASIIIGACLLWMGFTDRSPWDALMMAVSCGAAFSALLRFFLNRMREKHWWWMGEKLGKRDKKASKYDAAWHWIAWLVSGLQTATTLTGNGKLTKVKAYPDSLPAALAYAVEVAVAVVLVWLV